MYFNEGKRVGRTEFTMCVLKLTTEDSKLEKQDRIEKLQGHHKDIFMYHG